MPKKEIIDSKTIQRSLARIAYEIIERNKNLDKLVLAGIQTRGLPLAERLRDRILLLEGVSVPLVQLDTKPFRDDMIVRTDDSVIDTAISGKDVIIVDDVLYTGRTIRAALDNLVSHGRPDRVQLAVLIDRGHRELPIRPDYVGKNIPTSRSEEIIVNLTETDDKDAVYLVAAD